MESHGISACSGWNWVVFVIGVRMRIPYDPATFSGQKKAPARLCFWPSVDVEAGHPLRGMGHESPGCIQIDLQVPNIGLKTMRTQIRSWYHSGLPNTRVYAEREINTKAQWFAYELLKLQSDLAWYITNCNMWYGGFLKWGYPQMRKMFHRRTPSMETSMSCTTLSKQLQNIAWPKLPGSSAWVKYNLIIRTYMSCL